MKTSREYPAFMVLLCRWVCDSRQPFAFPFTSISLNCDYAVHLSINFSPLGAGASYARSLHSFLCVIPLAYLIEVSTVMGTMPDRVSRDQSAISLEVLCAISQMTTARRSSENCPIRPRKS